MSIQSVRKMGRQFPYNLILWQECRPFFWPAPTITGNCKQIRANIWQKGIGATWFGAVSNPSTFMQNCFVLFFLDNVYNCSRGCGMPTHYSTVPEDLPNYGDSPSALMPQTSPTVTINHLHRVCCNLPCRKDWISTPVKNHLQNGNDKLIIFYIWHAML